MLENYLEKRIDNSIILSEEVYVDCIIDITQWLWFELKSRLRQENRYFGIINTYMNSVDQAIHEFNYGCTEETCDLYGKALYLFKPLLIHEYRRLEKRKISKADRLIIIIKRLSEFLMNTDKTYQHYKEIKTLNKIVTKLYDNIRNSGKTALMKDLINNINDYMEKGLIGKYSIDIFDLDIDSRYKEKTLYTGNSTKLGNENNLLEISWTGNN